MHLNKLFMRNFKKYRRAEVNFHDGLTGIVGSNGSGKSTIVEAIAWALYGNRASTEIRPATIAPETIVIPPMYAKATVTM